MNDNTLATRFLDMGVGVFPLRPHSKEPAYGCSWKSYTCTRAQAALFRNYGVRLTNWFGVADTDSPEAEAWAAAHLPATPFTVQTARGIHRYYRIVGQQPTFIHRDGVKMEFRNQGQYVVGPGSVHLTGHIYAASDWSWDVADLPLFPTDFVFDDRQPRVSPAGDFTGTGYEFPDVVTEPGRHDELFRLLRQCKARGWDRDSTRDVIALANQCRCQPRIREDVTFDQWFHRAWSNPDRPFERPAVELRGLHELSGLRGL
jgi:hypothetical protein